MRNWPLRWKLALLTASLVGSVVCGVAFVAAVHLQREGLFDVDEEARGIAAKFYAGIREHLDNGLPSPAVLQAALQPGGILFFAEVLTEKGVVLYRTRELDNADLPSPGRSRFVTSVVAGKRVRVGEFEGNGLRLRVAVSSRTVDESRADLIRCYAIVLPGVLLIVAVGSVWVARSTLSPVEVIVSTAERITARHLDQRLPAPRANDELGRLTRVFNHMIDRLEASFQQATRFTSDASHELKTPLTIIRGELEATLRNGELNANLEKLLINLLEETERLTRITDSLLLLSRADSGRLRVEKKPIDVAALLRDLLEDVEILAAPKSIALEISLPEKAPASGDASFLRQMFLNLLDNAIKYNERGGRVAVTLESGEHEVVIRIGNTGFGIDSQRIGNVFDRFWRGDESRAQDRPGHGLGLSISREIARAHGGEIVLTRAVENWTEFQIQIPASI